MISDIKAIGIILTSASVVIIASFIIVIIHHFHWKRKDKSKENLHLVPGVHRRLHHHHQSLPMPHHHQHRRHHHPLSQHHHHHHHHRGSTPAPFHKSPTRELLSTSTPEFIGMTGGVEEPKPKLIVKQRTLPTVPEKLSDFQPKPSLLGISNLFFSQNVDEDADSAKLFQLKTMQLIQPRSNINNFTWKSYSFDSASSSVALASDEIPYMLTSPSSTPPHHQQFNGKIHLSLDFENSTQKLTIAIVKATDLPNCQYTGTADPYVKLDVLDDHGLQATYQTKIQRKTLNPVFNEKFTVRCEGISTYQIQVGVHDFDRFSRHRLIGHALFDESLPKVEEGKMQADVCKDVVLDLNRDHHQTSFNLGKLLISMRYLPTAGRLTVSIIKALNLNAHCEEEEEEEEDGDGKSKCGDDDDDDDEVADGGDDDDDDEFVDGELEDGQKRNGKITNKMDDNKSCLPDPYVKVALICHGRQVRKRKTSTKHSTTEPVYNESINFDVPMESIYRVHVDVRIHSKKSPSSKMLGACAIGPQFLGTSRDHWTAMLQFPRKPVAKWYQLSPYVKS